MGGYFVRSGGYVQGLFALVQSLGSIGVSTTVRTGLSSTHIGLGKNIIQTTLQPCNCPTVTYSVLCTAQYLFIKMADRTHITGPNPLIALVQYPLKR